MRQPEPVTWKPSTRFLIVLATMNWANAHGALSAANSTGVAWHYLYEPISSAAVNRLANPTIDLLTPPRLGAGQPEYYAYRSSDAAEGSREAVERSRELAEASREGVEGSRDGAERSRAAVEQSRQGAANSREAAEWSRQAVERSRDAADWSRGY